MTDVPNAEQPLSDSRLTFLNQQRLIEKLKKDTENFGGEDQYQLLQEYFYGLSTETLHDLLCYEDKLIRKITLWIISELGKETAEDFLEEAASQMSDADPFIFRYSSEIIACYGTGKYMDDFMRIFVFFEHSNDKIRRISIRRISLLSDSRLKEAYAYSVSNKILSDSHEKGLLSLIHINVLTASDITAMLNSDDSIIRKYGVIAAAKVYEKYPDIIKEAVDSEDLDVREYSKTEVEAKAKMAELHNQLRNRRRKH